MLTVQLNYPVLFLLKTLQDNGFESFIVGGAVRDVLLNKDQILDWDITTNAKPEEILELFKESFYDNAYGTVMVAVKHVLAQANKDYTSFEDFDVFDITTFRSESDYTNNRHPDTVEWGETLEEDVSRRDFTINALAFEIKTPETYLRNVDINGFVEVETIIHDFNGGIADLNNGLIKTVGEPQRRFEEDALRMMRAVRFASVLNFNIDPASTEAIIALSNNLSTISNERINIELFKILNSQQPTEGIELLDETQLLQYILPELLDTKGIVQGGRHKFDVWRHSLESLRNCPSKDPLVRLATLLHDIGKPKTAVKQGPRGVTFYNHEVVGAHMCNRIADRLRLSKKQKNKLFLLVRWHMFNYNPEMTDSAIKRFMRRVTIENINDMMNLRIGDRKGGGSKATSWRLRELQQRIGENLYEPMSIKDLKINGNDLMKEFDLKPGPILGKILNQLFEMVMDDQIENEYETLKNHSKEILLSYE